MYSERIYLTPEELLEYEFKIDARGYRPQEVDKVLDMVIKDETEYLKTIKLLEDKFKIVSEENIRLKQDVRKLKMELEETDSSETNSTSTNIDMLKRISQLEKIVYKNYL